VTTVDGPEVSPLHEVERRVQRRAKDEAIDLAVDGASVALRALIDHEITTWNEAVARGQAGVGIADPTVASERAFRNLVGYGPLAPLLDDPDVWEIMINAPADIFVKRHRGPSGYHDEVFHDDDHVVRTLTKILDDAAASHRKLDPSEGLQDAQLDDGARLHIVHGDVSRGGHVMVNIRKFTGIAFHSLRELVDLGTLTPQVGAFLATAVRAGASIVFSGAPGAGKTTLLSCCAA
jgi:pilus assembly protein CpaF